MEDFNLNALPELRCLTDNFNLQRFSDDGLSTASSKEQVYAENLISDSYALFKEKAEVDPDIPYLDRDHHINFLLKGLRHLPDSYDCLDASRPWLCYWILHSLELLDQSIPHALTSHIAQFLSHCQCPDGGFSGGPGQMAHLAPTYAAVKALCILGTEEAYDVINRETLYKFLMTMRSHDGAFRMHEGGEVDIRGAYCALSIAKITNILTHDLYSSTALWITSCQTYEGGFAGCPGMEAHGGYCFCGLAALVILNETRLCDMKAVLRWLANRQMKYEGGFQGRTNKLVDGCYSFWQGGAFPLIHMILTIEGDACLSASRWMFDQVALQEYVCICCQHSGGGLIDKPGKPRDYYHTCYCLSGLSVAQHFVEGKIADTHMIGPPQNELKETHPVYNICVDAALKASRYFSQMPSPNEAEQSR